MHAIEPDPSQLWCIRDTRTGEYKAHRMTQEAVVRHVDEWVRDHADQLIEREQPPWVEVAPLPDRWTRARLLAWARVDGEWTALVRDGPTDRWVSAAQVRRS
ncbi:hypothetical protein PZ938_00145 [Luteipulveratus sp. YIM 133132]|uniref:hypothetical protein n=1 Tax=Luteipulveratus flavus TaxID=3031728 RepID=UPI0023B09CF1|nr:hypothetical protein [Luteipulveratus sp. YIM 133132]MDE9364004.1 hypothetical protein [Luteipulveratus sp. YIM 133132]